MCSDPILYESQQLQCGDNNNWYPEYVPDNFQNLINSSLTDMLSIAHIS